MVAYILLDTVARVPAVKPLSAITYYIHNSLVYLQINIDVSDGGRGMRWNPILSQLRIVAIQLKCYIDIDSTFACHARELLWPVKMSSI